jgi:amidase
MDALDLAFTSALDQAKLIREHQISPLELVELYLDRIQVLDPQLGSFNVVAAEMALQDAKAKTENRSGELPPFWGVPIAIKDLNPVKDLPCSFGLKVAKNRIATRDEYLVTKLREAGFVILGKTATSQLGSFPYTEPPGFPPTRNPWNLDYTSGGSSGGSAAAVAAGFCAIAQGSDGGGSIRGPAACTGLVGLKPSRGRISFAPIGEYMSGCVCQGSLTRTVADTAALLDIAAGYVTGDPYWLPQPETSFLSATQRSPKRLKIGLITRIEPIGQVHPECLEVVERMARSLESMGHTIEAVTPDFGAMIEPFETIWRTQTDVGVPPFFLEKVNRWLWMRAKFTPASRYVKSMQQLHAFARQVVSLCNDYDVMLSPTYMHPTIRVGEWKKLSPARTLEKIIGWIAPCPAFNVTGQPAISIPGGFSSNGLPIGIQLIGRPADEATILALAAEIEAAHPWHPHRPTFAIVD